MFSSVFERDPKAIQFTPASGTADRLTIHFKNGNYLIIETEPGTVDDVILQTVIERQSDVFKITITNRGVVQFRTEEIIGLEFVPARPSSTDK